MKSLRLLTLLFILLLPAILVRAESPLTNDVPHEIARIGPYGHIFGMEWSPDGTMLAVNTTGGILIYNERLELLRYMERSVYVMHSDYYFENLIVWSPDSRLLASDEILLEGDVVLVWDVTTGTVLYRLSYRDTWGWPSQLVWSSQNTYLARVTGPGPFGNLYWTALQVWSVAGEQLLLNRTYDSLGFYLTGWTNHNRLLMAQHGDLQVYLDARTGDFADKAPKQVAPRGSSPDGRLRASCAVDLYLEDVSPRGPRPMVLEKLWAANLFVCNGFRWSADSKRLIVNMSPPDESGARQIRAVDIATGDLSPDIDARDINQYNFQVHPAGHLLAAVTDSTLQLWNMDTGTMLADQLLNVGMVNSIDWRPDSRYAVIASYHEVQIWDAASREPVKKLDTGEQYVIAARWSPDGRWIAVTFDDGVGFYAAESGERKQNIDLLPDTHTRPDAVWREDSAQFAFAVSRFDASANVDRVLIYDLALDDFVGVLTPIPGNMVAFSSTGDLNFQYNQLIYTLSARASYTTTPVIPQTPAVPDIPLERVRVIAIRPDGHYVAALAEGYVHVFRLLDDMRLAETGLFKINPPFWTYTPVLSWSPDGKYLLADGMNGALVVLGEFGD